MSEQLEIPIPKQPAPRPTLASLRRNMEAVHAEVAAIIREAEEACGELLHADDFAGDWYGADKVREALDESRRIVEADVVHDDDGFSDPTRDQHLMLVAIREANRALDRFDVALAAVREREQAKMKGGMQ